MNLNTLFYLFFIRSFEGQKDINIQPGPWFEYKEPVTKLYG